MSSETVSGQDETMNEQGDAVTPELEKVIEKIKHPRPIDEVIKELSPEEQMGNQAVAPQMIHEPSDLRSDFQRD